MGGAGEVERAQLQMRNEAARGGNDHISARTQAFSFLLIARTVVAAVDGHTVDVHIIGKALHGLVYLLGQLTRRSHDQAVDGIGRMGILTEQGQQGQKIGRGFSCAGLGDAHDITAFKDWGNTLFLDWGAFVKVHIVKSVEDVVAKF